MCGMSFPTRGSHNIGALITIERRRKRKYKVAGKFVERMKKIQKKAKAALGKAQEEMKKFTNRKQGKGEEYRIGDLVLLSTKDLKWQMKERRSEKLTEHFVGPYKVKGIVSSNTIELELSKSIKIHSVVNISRVWLYKPQVEGQKKIPPEPLIIKGQEEFKVEEILNKRMIREKKKFLVR